MKEHKIGERIVLEVVENPNIGLHSCDGCFFFGKVLCCNTTLPCTQLERSDGKNVIFKEVKNEATN